MDTNEARQFAERLDALVPIIALTLDEAADGDTLAGLACMSRFHFQRLFRRMMGEAPGAFRRRLLLERAAHALANTALDVTDIAFDAAYDSLEGFSRGFRRAYGLSPSDYRRRACQAYNLPSRNGFHFAPAQDRAAKTTSDWPGDSSRRSDTKGPDDMDLTDRLIEHDAWMTRRMLVRAQALPDAQLDTTLGIMKAPLPFDASEDTLRAALARMVFTKEVWVAAVHGRKLEDAPDNSLDGLLSRLDAAFGEFAQLVRSVRDENRWDESFVDGVCTPPETFTFGSMIAHVVTFSAYRRSMALKILESLGVDDLGYGDPIEWERSRLAGRATA
jgi:AraC family transcriptional regulator